MDYITEFHSNNEFHTYYLSHSIALWILLVAQSESSPLATFVFLAPIALITFRRFVDFFVAFVALMTLSASPRLT